MKILQLLFVSILIISLPVKAQWVEVFKDSANCKNTSVYFLNNDTGFVCAEAYYTFNNNDVGAVFRTTNGGTTWDTTLIGVIPLSIQFINDSIGFMGGQDGAVMTTYDMGATWIYKNSQGSSVDFTSLYFLDSLRGFRACMENRIDSTADGGVTWDTSHVTNGGSYWLGNSRIVFIDSLAAFIAFGGDAQGTYQGTMCKTTNGGISWSDLTLPNNFHPYSCYFFNPSEGIAVGRFGKLSKTSDGGTTWSSPDSLCRYSFSNRFYWLCNWRI